MMKRIFLSIYILITAFICCNAQENISIFTNWESIIYNQPDTVVQDVHLQVHSPFAVSITPHNSKDKAFNKLLKDQAVAIGVNDSVWFVNTRYLKKNFNGDDIKYLSDYTPLYFNDKIIYTQYSHENDSEFLHEMSDFLSNGMSVAQVLKLMTSYGFNFQNAFIFLINPKEKEVETLTSDKMTELLTPYLDIRRRYEAMYFYQEPFVINFYFMEYIDRISSDPSMEFLFD